MGVANAIKIGSDGNACGAAAGFSSSFRLATLLPPVPFFAVIAEVDPDAGADCVSSDDSSIGSAFW